MNYQIVFGASGGIGKEFCKQLLEKHKDLIICGRCKNKLQLLKNELLSLYPESNILPFEVDLSLSQQRLKLFAQLQELGVKISGLYYVSGIDTRKPFEKYSEEKIITQARVNFEGALSVTKFALTIRAEELKILMVSSACGFTPMPFFSEYSATKSALIYFFKALKRELKGKNVKITLLCPGSVPTRQDIIDDIKAQGLTGKLSKKSPQYIVKKGLKALDKNKTVCVPGFYNKFVKFVSSITPYKIKANVIYKKFKDKEKDAF